VLTGPDHFFGGYFAQFFQRPIPENDLVVLSDDKSGDGETLENAVQSLLALGQSLLRGFALRKIFQSLDRTD
jgi:hypothetical protein